MTSSYLQQRGLHSNQMNRNSSPGQQSRSPDGKPIRAQKSISDFLAADPAKRNRSKSPAD